MWWAVLALSAGQLLTLVLWLRSRRAQRRAARAVAAGPPADPTALRQIHRLAQRNEAILRTAMDGFFVIGADHRFIEVNDAFCRMTGYSAEELLRMRSSELEVARPTAGPSAPTGLHQFATAHRHKLGHTILLEISVNVLRDGAQRMLVGFARDITQRCRAEEALRESEERYRSVAETATDALLTIDENGQIAFANSATTRIFGYGLRELLGSPVGQLVPELSQANDGAERASGPLTARHQDGRTLLIEISRGRHTYAGRTLTTAILRDVTERETAARERAGLEEQMRQAQKLESLGMLAGGVAHDFNNLLGSILGHAGLAQGRLPADSPAREPLQRIVAASQRAAQLARQMLAYAGRASFDVQPLDLNALIREVSELLATSLPKSVRLALELAEGLRPIHADTGQMQQVVLNLILNAGEAIGQTAGTVTLRTTLRTLTAPAPQMDRTGKRLEPGAYVCLEVRDSGCGMDAATLARIFDPFFSTKFAGRGLGLAAILGIVRSHQGAIFVESTPGAGTAFTIYLPALERSAAPATQPRLPTKLPAGTTVLVIDDEPDIREVVQDVLTARGVRVLTAEDGGRGLALFRENMERIDAVLLDMTMPGLSGDAVFREILALRPQTRVILSSGYSEQESTARFADRRLAGFVQKPYTLETLVDKVGAALSGST